MKTLLRKPLLRHVTATFASVVLLSLVGSAASAARLAPVCPAWPLCMPQTPFGWFGIVHVLLGGVAGILTTGLFLRAWRDWRRHEIVLPLSTVAVILFVGQAFVGAMQVTRGFPLHLVVLHAATAASLWICLAVLMLVSTRVPVVSDSASLGMPRARDFLALGKPWIVSLLLVTTFGGLVLGGRQLPSASLALWTLLGGALAAAGSSALNQYIDRDVDKRMQRTSRRPLPSGRLTTAEALSFGIALCLVSYYLLAAFVNLTAALLSLAGIFYYVVFYSLLLKHATEQNIVIGGGAGAIPPMVGWAAAAGHLNLAAWVLFLIIFMWTPPHFWALAIVRSKDYQKAGIPMLPAVRGERAARAQILLYTVALVGTTLILPVIHAAGMLYLVAAIGLGAVLIGTAWRVWRVPGNKSAWMMYKWSSYYLMLIFVALVVDTLA
jgi:protoheme IX farnesyltransferase